MTDHIETAINEIANVIYERCGRDMDGYSLESHYRETIRNTLLRLMATAVSPEKTLAQARAEVRDGKNTKHGMKCPCCDKHTQVYRRNISSNTINWFFGFIQKYDALGDPNAYAYVTDLKTNPNGDIQAPPGGDYAKLEWWGLMESEGVGLREDGSPRTGRWRPTKLGRQFVRNEVRVRMYIWEYMSEPIENQPSCEMILLQDIEDVNFDFRSILHPANPNFGW